MVALSSSNAIVYASITKVPTREYPRGAEPSTNACRQADVSGVWAECNSPMLGVQPRVHDSKPPKLTLSRGHE